ILRVNYCMQRVVGRSRSTEDRDQQTPGVSRRPLVRLGHSLQAEILAPVPSESSDQRGSMVVQSSSPLIGLVCGIGQRGSDVAGETESLVFPLGPLIARCYEPRPSSSRKRICSEKDLVAIYRARNRERNNRVVK